MRITLTGPPRTEVLIKYRQLIASGESRHRARKEANRTARTLLQQIHQQTKGEPWKPKPKHK